jgi:hypothetical protein
MKIFLFCCKNYLLRYQQVDVPEIRWLDRYVRASEFREKGRGRDGRREGEREGGMKRGREGGRVGWLSTSYFFFGTMLLSRYR